MSEKYKRMKRITAALTALLLCLALNAVFPVYASGGTADITESKFNVDVDISWGEMSFTYTPEHNLWNPSTHAYDDKVEAAWTVKGNDITVKNVGEHGIRADFSAAVTDSLAEGDTVTAGFKTAADAESAEASLSVELDGVNEENAVTEATVYLDISGTISGDYATLATVTVTILAE